MKLPIELENWKPLSPGEEEGRREAREAPGGRPNAHFVFQRPLPQDNSSKLQRPDLLFGTYVRFGEGRRGKGIPSPFLPSSKFSVHIQSRLEEVEDRGGKLSSSLGPFYQPGLDSMKRNLLLARWVSRERESTLQSG